MLKIIISICHKFKTFYNNRNKLITETGYCDKCVMKLKPKASPMRFTNGSKQVKPPEEYLNKYNNQKFTCDRCGYINIR